MKSIVQHFLFLELSEIRTVLWVFLVNILDFNKELREKRKYVFFNSINALLFRKYAFFTLGTSCELVSLLLNVLKKIKMSKY